MTLDALLWLAGGSLLITAFAATGARSLRGFSRHDLEEICRRKNDPEKFSEILRNYSDVTLGVETLHVLGGAAFAVLAACYGLAQWAPAGENLSAGLLLPILAVAGLLLLAAQIWIPWAIAQIWATPFLYATWNLWRVVRALMTPLVFIAQVVDTIMHRLAGRQREALTEDVYEEEIRTIVNEGHREGLLEEDAREMIEGVIELGEADVAKIMTPRTDMVMMPLNQSLSEVVDFVVQAGHTRIPVFDATRDDVVGILYAKDLIPVLADGQDWRSQPLADILRMPYFVPETKRLDDLLEEFQQTRNHMAVVLDEYGGVSGLVTIEDVLEEIVGEIVDEYDEEEDDELRRIDDHTVEVLGRLHIDEVNEQLGLNLPEDEDYDTIGGFVFSQLGRIPLQGEELTWENVRIEVLETTNRRIERLLLEVLEETSRETA